MAPDGSVHGGSSVGAAAQDDEEMPEAAEERTSEEEQQQQEEEEGGGEGEEEAAYAPPDTSWWARAGKRHLHRANAERRRSRRDRAGEVDEEADEEDVLIYGYLSELYLSTRHAELDAALRHAVCVRAVAHHLRHLTTFPPSGKGGPQPVRYSVRVPTTGSRWGRLKSKPNTCHVWPRPLWST